MFRLLVGLFFFSAVRSLPGSELISDDLERRAGGPTIFLAGDSTTAAGSGPGLEGWGTQAQQFFTAPVQNKAVPGRSTRSFTDQGLFNGIINQLKQGDIVVIEFGHNEGGGPVANPNQGVCPGANVDAVCQVNGKPVFTFDRYMTNAINSMKAKGAQIVVSSQTPNNPFKDKGTPEFVQLAQNVAMSEGVSFVNHFQLTLAAYQALGANTVNAFFPQDNIHTTPAGAAVAAKAFVQGVLQDPKNPLFSLVVKNSNVSPNGGNSNLGANPNTQPQAASVGPTSGAVTVRAALGVSSALFTALFVYLL